MEPHAILTILLIIGFLAAAGAIMAGLCWLLVLAFRARARKRPVQQDGDVVSVGGLFEFSGDTDALFGNQDSERDSMAHAPGVNGSPVNGSPVNGSPVGAAPTRPQTRQ